MESEWPEMAAATETLIRYLARYTPFDYMRDPDSNRALEASRSRVGRTLVSVWSLTISIYIQFHKMTPHLGYS